MTDSDNVYEAPIPSPHRVVVKYDVEEHVDQLHRRIESLERLVWWLAQLNGMTKAEVKELIDNDDGFWLSEAVRG